MDTNRTNQLYPKSNQKTKLRLSDFMGKELQKEHKQKGKFNFRNISLLTSVAEGVLPV